MPVLPSHLIQLALHCNVHAELVKAHPRALSAAAKVWYCGACCIKQLSLLVLKVQAQDARSVANNVSVLPGLDPSISAKQRCCHSRAFDLADSGSFCLPKKSQPELPQTNPSANKHQLQRPELICSELQASGCTSDVTEDTVEEGEVDRHVKGLVEQVKQVTCHAP